MPEPESLLLKVSQSEFWSWPVLMPLAKGRFNVRVLAPIEALKILPVVPVAMLVTTFGPRLICVEVPINTFWPPAMERLEPTVKEAKVLVPVPPFVTGKTFMTLVVRSIVAFAMSPFTIWEDDKNPPDEECITPVPKAEMVGAWATVRLVMLVVAKVDCPATLSTPLKVVEPETFRLLPMPTLPPMY